MLVNTYQKKCKIRNILSANKLTFNASRAQVTSRRLFQMLINKIALVIVIIIIPVSENNKQVHYNVEIKKKLRNVLVVFWSLCKN